MCFSLTGALQSRLHRSGLDVVRLDQHQSGRHAPPPHLSNTERAFHQEFDVAQFRYNARTCRFERVPERRPTQIVPPRRRRRASRFSTGNRDRRGSRATGTGTGPSTARPRQNPPRRDYHAEDVEELRRYREEQARQNARQNQSQRRSGARHGQGMNLRRGNSASCSPCSSYEDIVIENRSPGPRPGTGHGYRSPPPSPSPYSPPLPSQGYEHERDDGDDDDDWEEYTARSRRSVRFASFDERWTGRVYDGADVLERTPRSGR